MAHVAVTGASSGIGEALAKRFGGAEHRLTLVARRHAALRALAATLPAETCVVRADLSCADEMTAWVDVAEGALGPIDILICNAGVQFVEPALTVGDARGQALMAVNLTAPMAQAHRVLPGMVERGAGTLVAIASVASIIHTPYMAHYNAAKSGLAAFFETLHVELAPKGVQVLTVYPGPVATPMEAAARARLGGSASDHLPTGTPDALANLVADALADGRPRVVYPKVYGLTRHLRTASQWLTNRVAPTPTARS